MFKIVEVEEANGSRFTNKNNVEYYGVDYRKVSIFDLGDLETDLNVKEEDFQYTNHVIICENRDNARKLISLSETEKLNKLVIVENDFEMPF